MREAAPIRSSNATTDNPDSRRDRRSPRLFAVFLWDFGFFSLGWLFSEVVWHVWEHGLRGLSVYLVFIALGKALGFGFLCGVFITFATWLVQEKLGLSKKDSSRRPNA